MKKNLPLIMLVLLMIVLSGCECEHEWTPADCVNPQVCTKCEATGESALGHNWADATCSVPETCTRCGETQGDSLGHNWAAATCSAPEVCTRCAETQGETLAHSFGDWSFGEGQMTHTCTVCAFEETTELDHTVYLESLLPGHWDYYGDISSGALEAASSSNIIGLYLSFGDGRRVTLKQATLEAETGTWEYVEVFEASGISVYAIDVHLESATMRIALYHAPSSPDDALIVIHQDTFSPAFSKNTQGVSLVTGNWGIAPNKWGYYADDRSYWLSFHDDRTVTCNINGTFEGTWHLVPLAYSGYILGYGVAIEYDNGGETEYIQGTLKQEELLEADSEYRLSLKYPGDSLYFGQVNDAELEAIKNSTNLLLGEWTSFLIAEEYLGKTGTTTADYSITFHEDGTFTADLGREHTGTWYVDHIADTRYSYDLYFDGQKEEAYCSLDITYGEIELRINNYPNSNDKYLFFAQMSEEESEALSLGPTLPVGDWISTYVTRIHNGTQDRERTQTHEYSLVFDPNGTFTAMLDTQISGTWEYTTMHRGDAVSFEYRLITDDINTQMFIHDDGELSFSFNDPNDSDYRLFYQFKTHAEEQTPEKPNP